VAVVVTHGAGPWLEESLGARGAQDYPNLSVLVIDAGSAEDPTGRVAAILPAAYIRRLPRNPGWSAAANSVLGMVEGAAFLVFCHDDVAPERDVVRVLVEEALRSNAGIVGPKLVSWDEPERLLQVGLAVDKTGIPAALVERGELDQEQHDAVRDVFAVPGAMTLVRADLFAELGGYDPAITLHGDDVDLCWRAQVAGARVVVAPNARARHLEALPRRRDDADRRRLQHRHRIRSMLKCYSFFTLLRVLPQAIAASVAEIAYSLVAGRRSQAADLADAWRWNLRRIGELRAARHEVQADRRMPDAEVRAQQVRGSARLRAFWRGQLGGEDRAQAIATASLDLVSSIRQGPRRLSILVWSAVTLVFLIGSRHLLTSGLPAVGQLLAFPDSPLDLIRSAATGWRFSGLGTEGPAPAALTLLGGAGFLLLGGVGLLQKLIVLGCIPAGAIGVWRLSLPLAQGATGSRRARLATVVVYLSIPLPYNALARGRWDGLVAYAAAPWILTRLARAMRAAPYDDDPRALARQTVGLGIIVALAAALAPATVALWVLVALAVLAGSVFAGGTGRALRAVAAAVGGGLVAGLLCFPWTLEFVLPGATVSSFLGVERAAAQGLTLGELLRFQTGPLGAAPLGWAFVIAAAIPLLIGREWRLAWAVRCWFVVVASVGVAWAGGRGWLGVGVPPPDVLLAPAAAALALAAALGLTAFEIDLPGFRFGWRQVAWVVAAAAVVAGTLPVLGAAGDGRWHLPDGDHASTLAWMPEERVEGDFRVLWIADPEVLPGAGWQLGDGAHAGLAFATSRNGTPTGLDLWPGSPSAATDLVPDFMRVATEGKTTRLGHLLAPMAVRYVVVVERAAPARFKTPRIAAPPALLAGLRAQVDLRRVQSDEALVIYQNVAWAPHRALVPASAVEPSRQSGPDGASRAELAGSAPVVPRQRGVASWEGPLPAGRVLLSESASSRWELEVEGVSALRDRAFGWANGYDVDPAGPGVLRFNTPLLHRLLLLVNAVVWLLVLRSAAVHRRRVLPPAAARTGRDVLVGGGPR
jgi:GT2 family glycosyltransferase